MSELRGKTLTLSRYEFRIDGVPVAIVTGFNYTRTPMTSEVRVAGKLNRVDAPINGYSHTISCQTVKSLGSDLVEVGLLPSVAGNDQQQLQAVLDFMGRTLTVVDLVTNKVLYECEGVVPTSLNESAGTGSHATGSWAATCDNVRMESEL
jgi:hypothetical protein